MRDKICVAAIGIGPTNSCCLYSFIHEKTDISCLKTDEAQNKFPTIALFNKRREFHSFGFEAKYHFNNLRNVEERKRWYFFEHFHRMTNDYTIENELCDRNGKRLETYKVYGSVIKFFVDRIVTLFRKRSPLIEKDVHLVVIVPPILTKSYKAMLEKAVQYAEFKSSYSVVRETEAIVSYSEHKWCKERNQSENLNLKNGDRFLLVNLEGRTASVTALTAKNGIVHRLFNVTGGGWGGQAVNEEFKQLLIKIVSAPVIVTFCEEEFYDWTYLEHEVDVKLKYIETEDEKDIRIRLPFGLVEKYMTECNETIAAAIEASPYSSKIRILAGTLMKIDVCIFKDLFTNTIEKLIFHIKEALQNIALTETKTIIMVGSFSESPLIQDSVKKAFPECNVLIPSNSEFTLIQGAVLEGHYSNETPTKYAIVLDSAHGVHLCHLNDERGCSEVEREELKIFLRRGDTVHKNDNITWESTLEVFDLQHVEIQFFSSPRNEIMSIYEEDVECLQKFRINFDSLHTIHLQIKLMIGKSGYPMWTIEAPGQNVTIKSI